MFNLPESISKSSILSITQLELLVEVKELPTVNPSFTDDRLKNIFQYYSLTPEEMDAEIHRYASELLNEGKVDDAWQVLLSTDVM
ncbi:MAG TPA: hypothetical protein VKA92_10515 [Segetibacter sp.]|nr:hypothetical protein [Segetibacter sp.]